MGLKPATNPDVEAATIELSIDGRTVSAKDGVSLYDVIASTGKIIPAMCYHYTFDPFGSCGMCLVMQEGKKAPVRSCTAKAAAGMVIRTDGDDLFAARKKAVEKHLSVHPLDCPVCDADGHCELQDMAFQHGVTNLANAKQKFIPEDTRSLVLDFNMNRCIACAECINVCKDVLMIDALQFMKKGGFNQVVAKGDQPLACEFCGDCLAAVPQVETGIVDWYASRGGNPQGVPVLYLFANQESASFYQTQTTSFISNTNNVAASTIVLNDYGVPGSNPVRTAFQNSGQPVFVVINGVTNSPSHTAWRVLVNHLGYGDTEFNQELANFRAIIDSVQPGIAAPTLNNARRIGADFEFNFQTQPGRSYRVLGSTNLSNWTTLQTLNASTNATTFRHTNAPPARNFYRVVTP